MPNQTSGPNTANKRLHDSFLSKDFKFCYITQTIHSGNCLNFRLLSMLKKQIKSEKPDLLHFSGLQASGFYAVLAARLAGYKNILVTIRGFSEDDLSLGKVKRFLFQYLIEPLTLRLCKSFYTVCNEAGQRKIVKKYRKKYLGVIYNAAPEIGLISLCSFRKKTGLEKDDFVVAIVGRLTYDKGITFILDAIDRMDNSKIKFVFLGDGEYLDIIKKRFIFNKNVLALGKSENVLGILKECDLFLFATLHENLSNALLEAMSLGLPIIATRVGGNLDVVEDGGNGFLIQPSNSQEIVEKIKILYEHPELRERFSQQSKKIIKNKFSSEVIYKQIKEIYNTML